tara:strand:+ start:49315 stop:50304 length:990 start_codon:yes stop_codon:yes gene_type:complete
MKDIILVFLLIIIFLVYNNKNEGFGTKRPIKWYRENKYVQFDNNARRSILSNIGLRVKNQNLKFDIPEKLSTTLDNGQILLKLDKKYQKSHNLMPNSFVLNDTEYMQLFEIKHKPERLYILEKYDKRKIVDGKQKILNSINEGYKVARELHHNPYLVANHKTSLQFFVLSINNKWYVHIDGYMFYSKEPYANSKYDLINNVTDGWIEHQIYKVFPLSLLDFREFLDKQNRPFTDHELWKREPYRLLSNNIFNRIYYALQLITSVLEQDKQTLYLIKIGLDHRTQPILEKVTKNVENDFNDYIINKVKHDWMELAMNKVTNKNQFIGLNN